MPYWDHTTEACPDGQAFAVWSHLPPCTPDGGLRGIPLRLPESAEGLRVGCMNFTCPHDQAPGGHNGIFAGQARQFGLTCPTDLPLRTVQTSLPGQAKVEKSDSFFKPGSGHMDL